MLASDRVSAPVGVAGSTDSGGSRTHAFCTSSSEIEVINLTSAKEKQVTVTERSYVEHLLEKLDGFRGPEMNFWLDIADALRKMQRAEEHRNELLIQISKNLGKAKDSLKPNYVDPVKRGIPTIIDQVKELRSEISATSVQKEKLSQLLLKKLISESSSAVSPKKMDDNRKRVGALSKKRKDRTSPPDDSIRPKSKIGRIGADAPSKTRILDGQQHRTMSEGTLDYDGDSESSATLVQPDVEWAIQKSKKALRNDRRLLKRAINNAQLENQMISTSNKQQNRVKNNEKRKRKRKRNPRPPQDAIKITPVGGKSFAEILKDINATTLPADCPKLGQIRSTKKGELIIRFKGKTGNVSSATEALEAVIKEKGNLTSLQAMTTVRIFDLNSGSTADQVQNAVKTEISDLTPDPLVSLSNPNKRQQVLAFVTLPAKDALKLIKLKSIQVGPFACRIRRYEPVKRCYKCLNFGHTSHTCSGPDRREHCYKCSQQGHLAKLCDQSLKCIACQDAGFTEEQIKHLIGTGNCMSYRSAWGKATTQETK